ALPAVRKTLASPILIAPATGATTQILDLTISSGTSSGPPVDVDLLGLHVTTSNIHATLKAKTGNGQLLGNLLFNVAHLLDHNQLTTLAFLLAQLAKLPPPGP